MSKRDDAEAAQKNVSIHRKHHLDHHQEIDHDIRVHAGLNKKVHNYCCLRAMSTQDHLSSQLG